MDITLCNSPYGLVKGGDGADAREHVDKCLETGLQYIVVENVMAKTVKPEHKYGPPTTVKVDVALLQSELNKWGIEIVLTGSHTQQANGKLLTDDICFSYYRPDHTWGGKLFTWAKLSPRADEELKNSSKMIDTTNTPAKAVTFVKVAERDHKPTEVCQLWVSKDKTNGISHTIVGKVWGATSTNRDTIGTMTKYYTSSLADTLAHHIHQVHCG